MTLLFGQNRRIDMAAGIVELDLHGKNVFQARIALETALKRAGAGTYRIRVIHGFNSGTAIRDLIRNEFSGRRDVLRCVANGSGCTDLILREY